MQSKIQKDWKTKNYKLHLEAEPPISKKDKLNLEVEQDPISEKKNQFFFSAIWRMLLLTIPKTIDYYYVIYKFMT